MPAASRVSQFLATASDPRNKPGSTSEHCCSKKANLSRLARSSVGGPSSRGSARRSKALRALGWCPTFLGLLLLLLVDAAIWVLPASTELSSNAALFQKVSLKVVKSEPFESRAICLSACEHCSEDITKAVGSWQISFDASWIAPNKACPGCFAVRALLSIFWLISLIEQTKSQSNLANSN